MSLQTGRHPHKRVSVRLAAVGGKQVRAELEGVGDAGVKGFGRMSKEAELANARLAVKTSSIPPTTLKAHMPRKR